MEQYYNVRIRVETEVEVKGVPKIKVVPELYLISAVSPTDAETKMAKHLEGLMAEYEVNAITKTNIIDVVK